MRTIILKLFCLHKWMPHAKDEREWQTVELSPSPAIWQNGYATYTVEHKATTEVLICSECGKIKYLQY